MWVCLNDAFYSIVASDSDPSVLSVRTRRAGDLERHFPGYEVLKWPGRDYAFRAFVPRQQVADQIKLEVERISYSNFKASVGDNHLHEAYLNVWTVMQRLQTR